MGHTRRAHPAEHDWRKHSEHRKNPRRRPCPNPEKMAYLHRKEAATHSARLRRMREWAVEYHCVCGAWHVGHPRALDVVPGPTFDPRTGLNV